MEQIGALNYCQELSSCLDKNNISLYCIINYTLRSSLLTQAEADQCLRTSWFFLYGGLFC